MRAGTLLRIALAPFAILIANAFSPPPAAAEATLKVSTCLARNHDAMQAYFKTFHEPLNARKAGLTLHYVGGPEAMPEQKQGAALKRGLIDIIVCPSVYYQGLVPEARLTGVNTIPPAEIRKNGGFELMQDAWAKGLNAKILGWGHWKVNTFYIYTLSEPKQSLETGLDLSGMKIRSSGLYNPFLRLMGATPITIAPDEVYTALERGLVDGLAWPEGSVALYGWERFLKYRIAPNFFHSTTMTVINLDRFRGLSKAHQDLLVAQGLAYERDSDAILAEKSAVDNARLAAAGVKTIELTGAARRAYLDTIYSAKWAENDTQKYAVDYGLLKSKVYARPGS